MLSDEEVSELYDEAVELYKLALDANSVQDLDANPDRAVDLSALTQSKLLELRNLLKGRLTGSEDLQQYSVDKRFLHLEYYLGLNQLHNFGEVSMWDKVKNLYQAARFFIDYLCTVYALGVPGLDIHISIIKMLIPGGRYSNFNLDPIRADYPDSRPQERLHHVTALWAELKNEASLVNGSMKFYQYTATHALIQIMDIARDKLPACLELARIQMETVHLQQPRDVLSPAAGSDIWSSFNFGWP